jgi:hypothetical protein
MYEGWHDRVKTKLCKWALYNALFVLAVLLLVFFTPTTIISKIVVMVGCIVITFLGILRSDEISNSYFWDTR